MLPITQTIGLTFIASQFGRFAASLTEQGPGCIDGNLASRETNGFGFVLTGNQAGYAITAVRAFSTRPWNG
jgi:hypothetical protein